MDEEFVTVDAGDTVWRFERAFVTSNWTCIHGNGCQGILASATPELEQGCCSYGAHLGDDDAGQAEARNVAALAAVLTPEQWEHHDVGPLGIFADAHRNHTRIVDHACVFLNRPDFPGGSGCALHRAALEAGESPIDWKPSVCWQLPIRVDWTPADATAGSGAEEVATVRRWTRADWGEFGRTMAWCCTERSEGGEAFSGETPVIDSLADELAAVAGEAVVVELRRRLG
ncbi:MAG: hypothetical protein HKN41_06495 [Ilumatobacter sp.]|nr:hypothetical protein [Ilumatobacter sp.]